MLRAFQMEEEVGFEPTVRYKRTTVFKTAPINRSGTPPKEYVPFDWTFIILIKKFLIVK